MKKILISLLIINLTALNCISAVLWKNEARNAFQNNEMIILEINPRTFGAKDFNGNGSIEPELGDISGNFINAVGRLDEIKNMGINTIHIMPITPTGTHRALGTAGSLYALSDFSSISPYLDNKENDFNVQVEFEIFVEECHKRDIKVIVDLPSCGAYDLYLKDPDLFYLNENNEPVSPADWLDVYLFKTQNTDGTVNQKLLDLHKDFIHMIQKAKVDGVRADVATIKPYDFWKQLIIFARAKDPQFLFLAEASNSWTEPPCKECVFTPYNKLFEVGFDGYYGSYFDYKDWTKVKQLEKQISFDTKLFRSYPDKKSAIASFITHDEQSPLITGGYNYAVQIIWLNVLLPLNPYYVDGVQYGDNYIYQYAGQKASKSYTDNETYYVHKGEMDIFNFSRQPKGDFPKLSKEIALATKFRRYAKDVLERGKFETVKTDNKEVFAFTRKNGRKTVFVILNKNTAQVQQATVRYKGLFKKDTFNIIKSDSQPVMENDRIKVNLAPSEIIILYSEN